MGKKIIVKLALSFFVYCFCEFLFIDIMGNIDLVSCRINAKTFVMVIAFISLITTAISSLFYFWLILVKCLMKQENFMLAISATIILLVIFNGTLWMNNLSNDIYNASHSIDAVAKNIGDIWDLLFRMRF